MIRFIKPVFITVVFIRLLSAATVMGAGAPNIYSDEKRGFSLEIPEGWEVLSHDEDDLAVVLSKPSLLRPFNTSIIVTLISQELPMPATTEELKLIVDQISGPSVTVPNIENYRVVSSKLDSRRGDAAFSYQASYELTKVKEAKERKVKTLNYLFRERGRYFALSLVVQASDYKKMEKVFYGVINSIRLAGPV